MDNDTTIAVLPGTGSTTPVAGRNDGAGNFQQKVVRGDQDMDSARYQTRVMELLLLEMQNHTILLTQIYDQLERGQQGDF